MAEEKKADEAAPAGKKEEAPAPVGGVPDIQAPDQAQPEQQAAPEQPEPKEEKKANVEAYRVRPLGNQVMVVADLPPIKSKEGLIDLPADATIEDFFRKGTVVAVGPDVKNVKKGQRVVYPFSDVYELERYYRRTYSSSVTSKWLLDADKICAVYEPAIMDEPKMDDVIHCLKAADLVDIRKRHYENLENMARTKLANMRGGGGSKRILTPQDILNFQKKH